MARLRRVGDWIADRYEVFAVHPGGMGVVYVAIDRLGEPGRTVVAIKTLRDEWLTDDDRAPRFVAECEIWIRLGSHPNIVHALAVEHFDGKPHILLELVTGGDLRKRIGRPGLDPGHALDLGIQFCLGMEHAVRQGLRCHRDVKPGNLLITEDGTLKITDFGLAVIRDDLNAALLASPDDPPDGSIPLSNATPTGPIRYDDPLDRPPEPVPIIDNDRTEFRSADGDPEGHSLRLTQTGSLMGTLPYMAPEQFRDAKSVDIRADIYSFGVVLFEMLTGELPFHGGTIARLDRAHTHYAPSVVPSIPKRFAREALAIDAIVQRCLSKDPADRYPTMEELRRPLQHVHRRVDPHH